MMDPRADDLLAQALELPDEDRLELAEALLGSVTPSDSLPFDQEWLDEVRRRAARIDSGESRLSHWAEVEERAGKAIKDHSGG